MAVTQKNGNVTFTAGEDLEQYRLVKLKDASTTTPKEVHYADAGELPIGVAQEAASSGDLVHVRLLNTCGTHILIADGAHAYKATLYPADDGKASDTVSGSPIGICITAATDDGDEFDAALFAQAATTAAGTTIADAGGFTTETTVEGALQEIYQDAITTLATIPVPLATLLETDGTNVVGYLGPATTPILDMANGDTDSGLVVTWAAGNVDAVLFQVPLPAELNESADVKVYLRAKMGGATDTPTIAIDSYFNEGDTKVEDVSAALSDTVQELAITIAAADVPSSSRTLTVELTPGTHDTDTVVLSALWVQHTKGLRTS